MKALRESVKADLAIIPHTHGGAVTSPYFNLQKYRQGMFVVTAAGTIAIDDIYTAALYEATDGEGSDAQAIAAFTAALGSADADAMPGITSGQLTMATVAVADTVTITVGGVDYVFTAAAAEDLTAREFDQSGTDTECATSLAACVNDATYGVPGVLADSAAAVVTLTSEDPGEGTFDVAVSDVTNTVPVPLQMVGIIEVGSSDLDLADGFTHVAVNLTVSAGTPDVQATLVRGMPRHMPPVQAAADQYPA